MHILWTLALIVGALAILVMGLVGVVQDLLLRGPYEPPLIQDDGLAWPARYQGISPQPTQSRRETSFAGSTWSERGSNQR